MSTDDNGGTDTAGKTFTQADVDRILRDRLARDREANASKYADYDDLKAKAADAEKTKTQLDKVLDKVTALEQRATTAERTNLRSDVATAKKLPAWMARRLTGDTKEALEADADEMLSEWKASGGGAKGEDGTAGKDDTADNAPRETAPAQRGRPREALRSGAPATASAAEETDPTKLAALVPRN